MQLTDNLDDCSIFHQVNEIKEYYGYIICCLETFRYKWLPSIIKSSGLNPVIIDVKCFALKSTVDQINQISQKTEDGVTAVLEFGLDENYLMIYTIIIQSLPICLREQDRQILKSSQVQEEKEGLVRRFVTQVKQAVQDFETKYEKELGILK